MQHCMCGRGMRLFLIKLSGYLICLFKKKIFFYGNLPKTKYFNLHFFSFVVYFLLFFFWLFWYCFSLFKLIITARFLICFLKFAKQKKKKIIIHTSLVSNKRKFFLWFWVKLLRHNSKFRLYGYSRFIVFSFLQRCPPLTRCIKKIADQPYYKIK